MKQREKTPSGQKGGAPAKATAHSAKQPAPAKQQSLSKNSSQTIYPAKSQSQVKPVSKNGKPKKKKNQQHDLIVTIDLVSIFFQ